MDLCKTSEEAAIILSHDFDPKTNTNVMYPRLETAIRTNNTEFVAHDFCQQVLREKMMKSDLSGKTIPWNSAGMIDKSIYVTSCILLMPPLFLSKLLQDIYYRFRTLPEER